jgi:hypothetical protein
MKVARTILTGGKSEKAYLSGLEIANFIFSQPANFSIASDGIFLCLSPGLALLSNKCGRYSSKGSKGYLKIKGKFVTMSTREVEALVNKYKQKAKQSYLNKEFYSDLLLALRYLINGVLQAEGSWSGHFLSRSSGRFNSKFSIGQNVSDESLHLFSLI